MPDDSNKVLAANLRVFRTARGWSQEKFADKCGLHRTYIGAIERGERNVTLATLNRIASAIGIPSAELISESRRAEKSK